MYLFQFLSVQPLLGVCGAGIALLIFGQYLGVAALMTREIADYTIPDVRGIFRYLRETWKASFVFSLLVVFQVLIVLVVLPWYLQMGGFIGMAIMSICFWSSVLWWLASQYYFPLHSRIDRRPGKLILKCFILLFDNPLFTLVLAAGTLCMASSSDHSVSLSGNWWYFALASGRQQPQILANTSIWNSTPSKSHPSSLGSPCCMMKLNE